MCRSSHQQVGCGKQQAGKKNEVVYLITRLLTFGRYNEIGSLCFHGTFQQLCLYQKRLDIFITNPTTTSFNQITI